MARTHLASLQNQQNERANKGDHNDCGNEKSTGQRVQIRQAAYSDDHQAHYSENVNNGRSAVPAGQ